MSIKIWEEKYSGSIRIEDCSRPQLLRILRGWALYPFSDACMSQKSTGSLKHIYQIQTHIKLSQPGTLSWGEGSNSRNDRGMWLVYSEKTRQAAHAHICETSQRVAKSEIKALWSWKFRPKNDSFFG